MHLISAINILRCWHLLGDILVAKTIRQVIINFKLHSPLHLKKAQINEEKRTESKNNNDNLKPGFKVIISSLENGAQLVHTKI